MYVVYCVVYVRKADVEEEEVMCRTRQTTQRSQKRLSIVMVPCQLVHLSTQVCTQE